VNSDKSFVESLLGVISPVAALTAIAYVTGWSYRTSYFAEFGLHPPDQSLHRYLLSSWAVLFSGLLIVAVFVCVVFLIEKLVAHSLRRSLLVFSVAMALSVAMLVWPTRSTTLQSRYARMLVLCVAIVVANAALRPTGKGSFSKVIPGAFLLLALVFAIFMAASYLGIQDAKAHMALRETIFSVPPQAPPEVTLLAKEPLDIGTSSSVGKCPCEYDGLRLIAFYDDHYYLFSPSKSSPVSSPEVYIVHTDNVLRLMLRKPIPVSVTPTPTLTPTHVVPTVMITPFPLPSATATP